MRRSWMRLTTRAVALVLGMLVGTAGRTDAQTVDCGEYCGPCGTGKKEGWGWTEEGDYDMRCIENTGGCPTAGCGAGSLVSDVQKDAASLSAMKAAATTEAMWEAVARLQGRLLVYPARKMVALRGERCAGNIIVAVAFLSAERVAALTSGGIPRLEELLTEVRPRS